MRRIPQFMLANKPHRAPVGWAPVFREDGCAGHAVLRVACGKRRQARQAMPACERTGPCHCTIILAANEASSTVGPVVVFRCSL